jgi:hypothetical protein
MFAEDTGLSFMYLTFVCILAIDQSHQRNVTSITKQTSGQYDGVRERSQGI